jgi:hypothetical protein
MSKILNEVCEENKNEILYIGALTGWLFIGTYDEYKEQIEDISKKSHATYQGYYAKAKRELSHAYAAKSIEEKQRLVNQAKANLDYIEAHMDLSKRPVIEYTPRIPDEDGAGMRIKIEGPESGKYWTRTDWRKSHE